jgi:two-component system, sensor histidine kinase and response regulator
VSEQAISPWTFVLDGATRVLFVDDDPILAEFARVHLATPSTVVEIAGDGAEAWERLQSESFDILLLDIEMPRLDGFALLERLRAEPSLARLPVMMLTGREDIASIDRAFQLGASSFATKPINWRKLSYAIRYMLRTTRMEAELLRERRRSKELLELTNDLLSLIRVEASTPLSAIIGFCDCIKEQIDGPVGESYLNYAIQIDAAARNLQDDFMDLIQYAQLTSGAAQLSQDEYPAGKILDASATGVSPELTGQAALEIRKPAETFYVQCDFLWLTRAIRHLVEDAMRDAAHVELSLSQAPDGGALATIAATGAGVSKAQATISRESIRHDMGMGAAFARCVIESHGGALRCLEGREGARITEIFLPGQGARHDKHGVSAIEAA